MISIIIVQTNRLFDPSPLPLCKFLRTPLAFAYGGCMRKLYSELCSRCRASLPAGREQTKGPSKCVRAETITTTSLLVPEGNPIGPNDRASLISNSFKRPTSVGGTQSRRTRSKLSLCARSTSKRVRWQLNNSI